MTGNPSHPVSTYNNRNSFAPNAGTPSQNQFSRPVNNQTLQPNYNWPDNSQVQTRNYDNKHITSPRGQQFEEQTPHYNVPNNNVTRPEQHQTGAPAVNDSAPVERSQPGIVAPPMPPPASQSSQSSNKSDQQGQNQNGRGH
jgi:hypothetical protein